MSGPVGVGGFEEGEFEGDSPTEKVAAQILLASSDELDLEPSAGTDFQQPHGSLLTRPWREMDSNFRFRAR